VRDADRAGAIPLRFSLPDGAEVAVKVQRRGVREAMQRDMVVLGWLVGTVRRLRPAMARRLNITAAFEEFRQYTLHELDFSLEAETLQRFRENFRSRNDVVFPEVFWDHSGPRVLTMSRVSVLRLHEAAARLTVTERQRLTMRILEIEMKMFVSDGFFHADLHPGNVFFTPDGKIVVLDVGMCGELTDSHRDHFMLYVLATVHRQVRRAFYHLTALTIALPPPTKRRSIDGSRRWPRPFTPRRCPK
jgi:ubiquinone biosynthesis protein